MIQKKRKSTRIDYINTQPTWMDLYYAITERERERKREKEKKRKREKEKKKRKRIKRGRERERSFEVIDLSTCVCTLHE